MNLPKSVAFTESCIMARRRCKNERGKALKAVYDQAVKENPGDITIYRRDGTIVVEKPTMTLMQCIARRNQKIGIRKRDFKKLAEGMNKRRKKYE